MLQTICLISSLCTVSSCTRVAGMQEVENTSAPQKQAPAECVVTFREFFAYVKKTNPSIIDDQQSQKRWLSQNFRKALAHNVARFGKETTVPDFPDNHTFLGVWNKPTTYSIIGSRHYDYRDADNPDDNRAVIDVIYVWDHSGSLDNQYPGEKNLRSFIFVFEDGAWKLDDIYNFTDEYAPPGSLSAYFSRE